jgi:GntR family transcriptional regulator, transcriptional repressor for pyruvate dehydrogenase complex
VLRKDSPGFIVLSAPRQVAAAIKREILEGSLKPGDALPPEQELADLFGVSRPTVRAGLQELCASQILVVRRGRGGGYRIADLSLEMLEASVTDVLSLSLVVQTLTPEQFFEVRRAIELLTAELAARNVTEEAIERLETIESELQANPNSPAAFELDLCFHRALAETTRNPLVISFESALIAVLQHFLGDGARVNPERAIANISDIIKGVKAGDPMAAREAMAEHLSHSARHFGITVTATREAGGGSELDRGSRRSQEVPYA